VESESTERRGAPGWAHSYALPLVVGAAVGAASAVLSRDPAVQGEALSAILPTLVVWTAFAWIIARDRALEGAPRIRLVVLLAFALRVVFTFLYYFRVWVFSAPFVSGLHQGIGYDALVYDYWARVVRESFLQGRFWVPIPLEQVGFVYFSAFVYLLFGEDAFFLGLLNTLFAGLLALETYRLVRLVGSELAARIALILVFVVPDALFLGSIGMKDVLVAYLLLAAYRSMVASSLASWRSSLTPVLCIAWLTSLRFVAAVGVLALAIWLVATRGRSTSSVLRVALLALVVVIGFATAYGPEGGALLLDPQAVWQSAQYTTSAETSLARLTFWDYNPLRAYLVPIRMGLLLVQPFPPFTFGDAEPAMASATVWLILLLAPAALWTCWRTVRCRGPNREHGLVLVVPLVLQLAALAILVPILSARWRLAQMPFFVSLAAVTLADPRTARKAYLVLAPLLLVVVLSGWLAYAMIKSSK
jgi:hypothetical protein